MGTRRSEIRRNPDNGPSFSGVRRYNRRKIDVEVFLQDDDGWEVPLEAVDLSPVGLFVESDLLFDVGEVHTLIFRSPDGDFVFRIRGRIARVSTGEGSEGEDGNSRSGMAYEFLETDSETWAKLCSLVAEPSRK